MKTLTSANRKHYRSLGHKLKPVVMIADKGLTDGVHGEIDRALNDHELIKVRLNVESPTARRELVEIICTHHCAQLVQTIGKIALILRHADTPNPKLSNLLR